MKDKITIKSQNQKKVITECSLNDQNEFLDLKIRFNSLQVYDLNADKTKPVIKQRSASRIQLKTERIKQHNSNISIKKILSQIRIHEEILRDKIYQLQMQHDQDQLYEQKMRQFLINQKRIKNRLAVQKKRLNKLKLTLNSKEPFSNKINKSTDTIGGEKSYIKKTIQDYNQIELNGERQNILRANTSIYQQLIHSIKPQTTKLPPNEKRQQNGLNHYIPNHKKKFKTHNNNKQVLNSKSQIIITNFSRLKQRKDNYVLPRNPIKKQLFNLYIASHQKPLSFQKAAQLVKKMQIKNRLKKKNIYQVDFKEASGKVKLLNYFYNNSQF